MRQSIRSRYALHAPTKSPSASPPNFSRAARASSKATEASATTASASTAAVSERSTSASAGSLVEALARSSRRPPSPSSSRGRPFYFGGHGSATCVGACNPYLERIDQRPNRRAPRADRLPWAPASRALGAHVAKRLGRPFVDIDTEIERRASTSVSSDLPRHRARSSSGRWSNVRPGEVSIARRLFKSRSAVARRSPPSDEQAR